MAPLDPQVRYSQADLAALDHEHLCLIRENVEAFLGSIAGAFGADLQRVLDIAPQDHQGVGPHLGPGIQIETLDIDPSTNPTYVADLCAGPTQVPADRFDAIVCTEVLEHTLDPFAAVRELRRMVRPGGVVFASAPFNFRIHGPLPDCWRFTEHGLRSLFREFVIEQVDALETPGRPLMPIHYTLVARRPLVDD